MMREWSKKIFLFKMLSAFKFFLYFFRYFGVWIETTRLWNNPGKKKIVNIVLLPWSIYSCLKLKSNEKIYQNGMFHLSIKSFHVKSLYYFNSELTNKINKITNKTNKNANIFVILLVLFGILLIMLVSSLLN
jgi:hypothetical protein